MNVDITIVWEGWGLENRESNVIGECVRGVSCDGRENAVSV